MSITIDETLQVQVSKEINLRRALADLIHAADPQTNVSGVEFYRALMAAKAALSDGQGQEPAAPLPPPLYCAECGSLLAVAAEGFKAEPDGKTRVVPCARCTRRSADKVALALSDQLTALRAEIVGLREDLAKLRAEVGAIPRPEPVPTQPIPTQPWWVPPAAPVSPVWPWYQPIITCSAAPQSGGAAQEGQGA